jgi:hypothetical protein
MRCALRSSSTYPSDAQFMTPRSTTRPLRLAARTKAKAASLLRIARGSIRIRCPYARLNSAETWIWI